jgi:hypothetical protein
LAKWKPELFSVNIYQAHIHPSPQIQN